jgi:hypothetical protein
MTNFLSSIAHFSVLAFLGTGLLLVVGVSSVDDQARLRHLIWFLTRQTDKGLELWSFGR